MTPSDVLKLAKEKSVKMVDLRFIDMPGLWQHFSIPVSELNDDLFKEGIGFDGSSIRGFQTINESDMLLVPDPETARIDPFTTVPTLVLICDVRDPITGERYDRDPRNVAKKAEAYVKSVGVADTVYIGPELEFFILDNVRFDQDYDFGLLLPRLRGGVLERGAGGHAGTAEPRLPTPLQAGLLPGGARRSLPGPALGDGGQPRGGRGHRAHEGELRQDPHQARPSCDRAGYAVRFLSRTRAEGGPRDTRSGATIPV